MFSGSCEDFAVVMLVEELSNSSREYIEGRFGEGLIEGSWSDEHKMVYVLIGVVGWGERVRLLRLISMLEKYLIHKRRDRVYNFSVYRGIIEGSGNR